MKRSVTFTLLTAAILSVGPIVIPITASDQYSRLDRAPAYIDFTLPEAPEAGKFTLSVRNGEVACTEATAQEVQILRRDPTTILHSISQIDPYVLNEAEQGLKIIEPQVSVLDEAGSTVSVYPPASFSPGQLSISGFALEFSGINQWLAGTQASVTLFDRFGNAGASFKTGILTGESGGPNLLSLSFDGRVLKIKGKRLNEPRSLEVNGQVIAIPGVTFKGVKKAQVEATAEELGLGRGPNRVRVINKNGLRSNALILDL